MRILNKKKSLSDGKVSEPAGLQGSPRRGLGENILINIREVVSEVVK